MSALKPFNFRAWIDAHREYLKPPVCNKLVFRDSEFIIMVVGGPNSRTDYHDDPGEEFFYQIEGDMVLRTIQDGERVDIPIREGEVFLLPARVPHSPQRFANTVGLVIERKRRPDEQDGFLWYCDHCQYPLYGTPRDVAPWSRACAFAPRCDFADEACVRPDLELVDSDRPDHLMRCVHPAGGAGSAPVGRGTGGDHD